MRLHLLPGSLLSTLMLQVDAAFSKLYGHFRAFTSSETTIQLEINSDRLYHRGSGRRDQVLHLHSAIAHG